MLHDRRSLRFREEFRSCWVVRQPEKGHDSQEHCDAAQHHEHDPPAFESGVCDMLKAERQETADNLAGAQSAVPEREPGSLFGLGVPSTAYEYQRGNNTSLEYSKEDARRQQTPVVFGSRSRCSGDAPEDNVYTEDFARWKPCQDMTCV